jgi:hypothetical protein
VELVTTLKESAVVRVPAFTDQPEEEVGSSSGDARQKGIAIVDESSGMGAMLCLAQATQATLVAIGPPPPFEPLARFMAHLEIEYGGFRHDQMQRIQDFHHEKEDTPRTMYTWLAT